jgi:hypothetical protein
MCWLVSGAWLTLIAPLATWLSETAAFTSGCSSHKIAGSSVRKPSHRYLENSHVRSLQSKGRTQVRCTFYFVEVTRAFTVPRAWL